MPTEKVALYGAPALYDALVPSGPCEFFYSHLARHTGGPVLELACGTGRLSVPLAASGNKVVGIDISAPMLAAGRRKAKAAGVEIEFIEGDMRSFDLRREFALVVVSCNSLAHLVTNKTLLMSRPEGVVPLVGGQPPGSFVGVRLDKRAPLAPRS